MPDLAFAAISTLRYDSSCNLNHPDNEGPPDFYRLGAHIRRLMRTAAAAGWKFDRTAGWDDTAQKTEQVAAYIRLAVGLAARGDAAMPHVFNVAQLSAMAAGNQERKPGGVWRVRLDLLPPGNDANLKVTLVQLGPFSPTPSSENLFPQMLPSPSELGELVDPRWYVSVAKESTPNDIHTRHKTSNRRVYDLARLGLQPTSEILLMNESGEIMDASITTPYFWKLGRWVTPAVSCNGQQGVTRTYALEKGLAVEAIIQSKDVKAGDILWLSNGLQGFHTGVVREE